MIERIEPKPKIPLELRTAALQSKIVPFIGAGVSQLGGCPGWDEFANAALKSFVKEGKLRHDQLDQIRLLSSRAKISMALELESEHGLPIKFAELLKPSDEHKKKTGDRVYQNLSRLATTFVTTNYDDWLDQTPPAVLQPAQTVSPSQPPNIPRRSFCKRNEITVENLGVPNAVFHIHGSVHERDSMILTTIDYLHRYSSHRIDGIADKENPFLTFLEMLFKHNNVLFVGYGLNELEILEYVVQKGIQKKPPRGEAQKEEAPHHYVLQGFFSHEIELARSLDRYFRQFGIGLLPFSRDERDWDQLIEVIDYLAAEIPPGPVMNLPKLAEMEDLLP